MSTATPEKVYKADNTDFHFNDLIVVEMVMGASDEERVGRIVQVRKGVGAFGSDVYIAKLANESYQSFSNVRLRKANDLQFEDAFYIRNGRTPPKVEACENYLHDDPDIEYTIMGKYPETGFVVDNPQQPNDPQQSFSMTITTHE